MASESPTTQFEIHPLVSLGHIGHSEIALTNSGLYMIGFVVLISAFMLLSTKRRALIPGRWQGMAEMFYEFTAVTIKQAAGEEGMRFFPFVFSVFMFVTVANVIGEIPYSFSVTSHIIVTFALSILVIAVVLVHGFWTHGIRFLRLFVPHGIPKVLLPLVVSIEIVSFVSRPISLSVRLFANMLAGHITLAVFAGFVAAFTGFGVLGWFAAVLPLAMVVALAALEMLIAFLQAYVFAILTCIYLNDALYPSH